MLNVINKSYVQLVAFSTASLTEYKGFEFNVNNEEHLKTI